MYYVENKLTRKEIAAEFDVTEERLRQIIRRALRRIRSKSKYKNNQENIVAVKTAFYIARVLPDQQLLWLFLCL